MFSLLREAAYAHMHHDVSFFERILDEDYVGTGPDGETRNKAEEIADVKRLDNVDKKFEFDDLHVLRAWRNGLCDVPWGGLLPGQRTGLDRAVSLHCEFHQCGWPIENRCHPY